jgi:hypothetical protein
MMFNDRLSVRAAERQSMKWLTEYSNGRATIISISKPRKNGALLGGKMSANQAGRYGRNRSSFTGEAKIVASRDGLIVEIISPLAFTFKIPFH